MPPKKREAASAAKEQESPRKIRNGFHAEMCGVCGKHPLLKSCVALTCYRCCAKRIAEGGEPCPAHAEKMSRREEEKRLVDEQLTKREEAQRAAIFGISKEKKLEAAIKRMQKLKKGEFSEDAFEELGDTVVIWSLAEYFANPAYSAEHLEAECRRNRSDRSNRSVRRKAGTASSSSSSISTTESSTGERPQILSASRRAQRAAHCNLADFIAERAAIAAAKSAPL